MKAENPTLEDRHFPAEARYVMEQVRPAPAGKVFFLTGVAGSGKTTLLRHILRTLPADVPAIVLAPTGVAAVRAGGQTIHSFFRYSPKPFTREQVPVMTTDQMLIIRKLRILVIDEISMVRADLLDCVDESLRRAMRAPNKPFGGLCVLLTGDLSQLPPVVATDADRDLLRHRYASEFFFDAHVFLEVQMQILCLRTVHRQAGDPAFLRILEKIRMAEATEQDLSAFSSSVTRRVPGDPLPKGENLPLTLCTTNAQVDYLNERYLNNMPGKVIKCQGIVEGKFPAKAFPVDEVIDLKVGCMLMFQLSDMKGDEKGRRWLNGTRCVLTGVVREDEEDEFSQISQLLVTLKRPRAGEDSKPIEVAVDRHEFEAIRYKYDRMAGKVSGEPVGKFSQFPIRLAYACSIHKAQGETHDRVNIDLGRGAFASGQLYVALSRCRTMAGVSLTREIWPSDQILEPRVKQFLELLQIGDEGAAQSYLEESRSGASYAGGADLKNDNDAFETFENWEQRITPERIMTLLPGQVFGFGSNLLGKHRKGAALDAKRRFGAVEGVAEGPQGDSYAIPTKLGDLSGPTPLGELASAVARFLHWARKNPDKTFLITPIGCGLADRTPNQVAPLFAPLSELPPNVCLPRSFWEILISRS